MKTKETVLCSIATRGRYDTTLPLALQAIIMQTRKVDKLIVFDDNDNPQDLRTNQMYAYLFHMLSMAGIDWEWVYALKKGQHYSHQTANLKGYTWVWRVDDDCVPEPNVLETLMSHTGPNVGAVGGSILTPPFPSIDQSKLTGKIDDVASEPSMQWNYIKEKREVEHLHCSFLYRSGVYDYNLGLSRVAFREETLFTYGIFQKGYKVLVVPNAVSWHLKNQFGGIRTEQQEMFMHDEYVFRNFMKYKYSTIVVLDNGMGDHIVFKKILPEIKDPVIFSCYNEIVPGQSIQEAINLFGNIDQWNIYNKMDQWRWTDSLENAFRKLYLEKAPK